MPPLGLGIDPGLMSGMLFPLMAISSLCLPQGRWTLGGPEGPYEVVLDSNVRVAMRDGVKLATDVYRPARGGNAVAGPFPVIMERTPYGRNVTSFRDITQAEPKTPKTRAEVAAIYVRQGYVVVFQDCRGRYDSEGEFVKYLSEGADGFDTCRWLVAQPWGDGRIGTM